MVELAGVLPFGGGGVNIRQNPVPVTNTVPPVEPSLPGQGLSARMSSNGSQADSGAGRPPDQKAQQYVEKKKIDPNALPGPPPTFQISLLEMDRDLAETLARINAAHSIAKDAKAVAGNAPAEPQPAIEADDTPENQMPTENIKQTERATFPPTGYSAA